MLLKLPHVTETIQWGANLVFWVGQKGEGGRIFAVVDLDGKGGPVISYVAGPERFAELVEQEGFIPAPYFARAYWVAVESWGTLRAGEWERELTAAREIVYAKLTKRVREGLAASATSTKKPRTVKKLR